MIPDLQKETRGRRGAPNAGHDHVRRLVGREPVTFRAFVETCRADLTPDAYPLEIHMRRIVHHDLGEPARVLRVEDGPSMSLGQDQVRVRLSYAPIHPGDLLGIMGSPAFGTPPTIASGGGHPDLKAPAS
jgi:hypothetical protein